MPTVFENPGEINILALTTLGVSVKEKEDAIGYKGSGAKYAIPGLLRLGHRVEIQIGEERKWFNTRAEMIRGESFELVYLDGERLGITTNFGKEWEPWMYYRELYCNAVDEGGTAYVTSTVPEPEAGVTRVIVYGADFEEVHHARESFILGSNPIVRNEIADIHSGVSSAIFYRGIKVSSSKTPSFNTYNINRKIALTEDRTLKFAWDHEDTILKTVAKLKDKDMIRTLALLKDDEFIESTEAFNNAIEPSEEFMEVVGGLVRNRVGFVAKNFYFYYKNHCKEKDTPEEFELEDFHKLQFNTALEFCERHGFEISKYSIRFAKALKPGLLGTVLDDEIWLSRECFEGGLSGTQVIAGTLIEEFIHLETGAKDFSRKFQEYLLGKMLNFMQRLDGKPIG